MKAGRHTDQLNSASAVVALLGVIRKCSIARLHRHLTVPPGASGSICAARLREILTLMGAAGLSFHYSPVVTGVST